VLIKDGTLSFNGVDRGAIVAPVNSVTVKGGRTVYRTAAPSSQFPVAVTALVTPGACSDGMSDRTYPSAARVEIDYAGASPNVTLNGCAAPERMLEQAPRP
jgi:uncharacterized membrane protein